MIEVKEWLPVVAAAGAVGVAAYFAVSKVYSGGCCSKDTIVNRSFAKDQEKVVHAFDMEDLGNSVAFCRCWRSKKFPYCDGSHVTHNKEAGDNVGPLCLSRKVAASN